MDDPNITMEEYIRLKEEKAHRRGKVYNWETAKYALLCEPTVSPLNDNEIDFRMSFDESEDEDYTPMFSYFDDLDIFKDFENEFPAIVYNDALTSKSDFSTEPIEIPHHIDEFDLKTETSLSEYMALPPRDQRHQILMEHRDAQGQSVFTSRAWRWLFEIRGPLMHELILEFFSTFRFGEVVVDLDTVGALQFQLGGVRHCMSSRQFIFALGLHTAEEMETAGFGLYWAESGRQISDKGDLSAY
ncbi:hypothetical protein Tco_0194508 [Tanacetum coccineum]